MTDPQLDAIETALNLRLPAAYRAVSRDFPFRPVGNDWVYWFYDDPRRVIAETCDPLPDGEYDRGNWQPGFVVIGQGAAGDLHVLDTAREPHPVYFLSHEDHSLTPEWPSFQAFIDDWLRGQELSRQAHLREESRRRAERRRVVWLLAAVGAALLTLGVVVWLLHRV